MYNKSPDLNEIGQNRFRVAAAVIGDFKIGVDGLPFGNHLGKARLQEP